MPDSEPDKPKPPIHLSPRNAAGLLKIMALTFLLASLAYGLARLLRLVFYQSIGVTENRTRTRRTSSG